MDHTADLEQRIKVAGQARSGGEFTENLVGLQIEDVRGAQADSGKFRSAVLELNGSEGNGFISFPEQEQKDGIAYGDLIAVIKVLILDRRTIHQGSVAALEVADLEAFDVLCNQAMTPGNGRVR